MCAKMAKVKQTDYTIGGKAISDTAIPLYQQNLTKYNDLSNNYQDYLDDTINKYYSGNTQQSDFLRNYNRAMGNVTANNYAATHGGYSSSGDMARMDQQRSWNDLASRIYDVGVTGAQGILNNQINAVNAGLKQYNAAYGLGKEYSKWDQYNDLVDQNNSFTNQLGGTMTGAGQVLSSIPNPWTQAIGAALQTGGNLMSTDTSGAFNAWDNANNGGRNAVGASAQSEGGGWANLIAGKGGLGDQLSNAYSQGAFSKLFGGAKNVKAPVPSK